ncbi:MAG: uracil-DNA glycosylase [Candidatus Paceibacterota bacterium]
MKDKGEKMYMIHDEVLNLTESPLYKERVNNKVFPVIGEGSHDAKIMFIGEAPGRNEAATGRPFCGASGKILDELLADVNLVRESVYITNIVKDRPPQNRDPSLNEIELYAPFLDRQIEIIEPQVIATLGRYAMEYVMRRYSLLDDSAPISINHGKVFETKMNYGSVKVIPLYHPAVAIYNNKTKETLFEDFKKLISLIK